MSARLYTLFIERKYRHLGITPRFIHTLTVQTIVLSFRVLVLAHYAKWIGAFIN